MKLDVFYGSAGHSFGISFSKLYKYDWRRPTREEVDAFEISARAMGNENGMEVSARCAGNCMELPKS